MRTKMIVVLVCTLMILATTLSVAGNLENERIKIVNNETVFLDVTPPEVWNKTYGGDYYDSGYSVQETSDGGYIFCGNTIPDGSTYSDVYLVKTDADGNVEWEKNHGGSDAEYGYSVQETSDGGFIVAGYVYDNEYNNGEVYLLKTNAIGDYSWSATHGGEELDEAFSIQQTNDGGFIVVGFTESDTTNRNVYLIKTSSDGKATWTKTFGGADSCVGYCVKQTSDSGYIIAGSSDSTGSNNDLWLIKTDVNGNQEWSRKYGGLEGDWAKSVQQTSDYGYIITGTTVSYGAGGQDLWLMKTGSNGVKEWDVTFGGTGSDRGEEVQETSDGDFIVIGLTTSFGAGGEDAYLVKTDGGGSTLWTKTMGGSQGDSGHSIYPTSDGDFIVAGETLSYGSASSYDAWLIKVRGGNNPPNKPATPDGPNPKVGWREDYKSSAVDPDGDQVFLMFDWGDGQYSDWIGPVSSGEDVTEDHWWVQKGTYLIKTKAKDVLGEESVWSDPLTITTSKEKVINIRLLNWLENHPHLFPMVRYLLGL